MNSLVYEVLGHSFTPVPETVCVVELNSNIRNSRYFNDQLCIGRPKYGHICQQRLQINIYQCFILQFSHILDLMFFSGFSAAIFDRRYEPSMLVCNPIQSNELKNNAYQFKEICANIEDVRVPH